MWRRSSGVKVVLVATVVISNVCPAAFRAVPPCYGDAVGLSSNFGGSRQRGFDHGSGHVCESEISALEAVGESRVVDAHEMKDGGVEVVDVDGIGGDVVGVVVGFTDQDAALDAAAGEPGGEAAGVVVAAVVGF